MKTLSNIFIFLLSITVLGGIIISLIFGIKFLIEQYEYLDPKWSSGLLIISAVLLICALILGRAIHSVTNNKDKVIHPEKSVVYGNFIELWSRKEAFQVKDENHLKDLGINSKQMMLWAGDGVLKAYDKLQQLTQNNGDENKIQTQIEKVILAMRRDVGHRNIGILRGDLLGAFHLMKKL